ncbi:MAG: T9SS type A sorting domain-containing protein, partial [Bacteroidales bacterium]|nr:T9SS type A sorting domain-containing protein [Bacteroidales bacterium]
GDMTDWNPVDMLQDGQDWMLSLDIFPGAYEWGVLEDDGSPNGIWLVIGDNLVVNIDNEGIISGDTIYVVTFVGIDEMSTPIGMYPNPVKDKLWIEKDSDGKIDIQLLDATGSLIKMMNYSSSKIEIDLSFLSSGLYFLQLQEGDQVQMLKFIKQ